MDNSGSGNAGTPTSVVFGNNGKLKTAAAFDGSSSKIDLGTNASLTGITGKITVQAWITGNGWSRFFLGSIDEVAVWNRTLSATEVLQLYRRGANRVKHQVRICTASDCSDDLIGANWKGPDGTNQSYFSELYNMSTQAATPSGVVNATLPTMTFSNFTSPIRNSRYFQYRSVLESDDTSTACNYGSSATWCSPELKSVGVAPVHYDSSSPTISTVSGPTFNFITALAETLGASCAGGVSYNLSLDKTNWYWWDFSANSGAGGWALADGTSAQTNAVAVVAINAAKIRTQIGNGTLYLKAFLKSSGTVICELDDVGVTGLQ